jgi:hypothetical protein
MAILKTTPQQPALVVPSGTVPTGTDTFTGLIGFIADTPRHGALYVTFAVDGEKQPPVKRGGFKPNRSVILTKDATTDFLNQLSTTIFQGDYVEVTVRTVDLADDMHSGRGLTGQKPFLGTAIKLVASQFSATPAVSHILSQPPV